MLYETKSSPRDRLTATTDEGRIELTEEELIRVAGGRKAGGTQTYYKLDLEQAFITNHS